MGARKTDMVLRFEEGRDGFYTLSSDACLTLDDSLQHVS